MLTRRQFMGSLMAASAASVVGCATASETTRRRPNIVFFLVDDMGWQDTSLPFWRDAAGNPKPSFLNRRYRTPNMERLAARGMLFTDAYAQAICSPTRVSLLTGMNSARHRVTDWTLFRDTNNDERQHTVLNPLSNWAMNGVQPAGTQSAGSTTHPLTRERFGYTMKRPYVCATGLPQLLADAGYVTIHCGKAHFGAKDTPGADPQNFGFHYNIAGTEIGGIANYRGKNHYGKGPFHVQGLDENNYYEDDVIVTEALTREAIKRLDTLRAESQSSSPAPFYLYMAHYAIHAPFHGDNFDPRFSETYKNPKDGAPWTTNERNYATLIEGMDKSLGDLMDWLDRNGLTDNTVILFMADNGGLALPSSGRSLGNERSNWPLSFGKGSGREGGIREPMIVSWPGVTSPGSICRTPVIVEDFFPSILECADVSIQKTVQRIDGKSFVPLLKGQTVAQPDRPLLFHQPNLWGEGSLTDPHYGAYTALRQSDWKLIYWHADQSFELFDLSVDLSEKHNLAERHPERVRTMAGTMTDLLTARGAQFTTYKKDVPALNVKAGDTVPYPIEAVTLR